MFYQHAVLEPDLKCHCIVSLNNELKQIFAPIAQHSSESATRYNMFSGTALIFSMCIIRIFKEGGRRRGDIFKIPPPPQTIFAFTHTFF